MLLAMLRPPRWLRIAGTIGSVLGLLWSFLSITDREIELVSRRVSWLIIPETWAWVALVVAVAVLVVANIQPLAAGLRWIFAGRGNGEGEAGSPRGAEVEIVEDGRTWLLSVTGRDEVRRYRAKAQVLDSNMSLTGASEHVAYTLCWRSNGKMDSELLPGHTDELVIAREDFHLDLSGPYSRYKLAFADPEHHQDYAHTKTWVYGEDGIERPVVILSVVLSSDPPMPEPMEIGLRIDDRGVERLA